VFIAISMYLKPLEEVDRFYPEHFAWLEGHYASGHFLASGPRLPRIGGLIIARAESRGAFASILAEDPFEQNGLAKYEIFEFTPGTFPRRSSELEAFLSKPLGSS
jgi:uncharacterized protein YciI